MARERFSVLSPRDSIAPSGSAICVLYDTHDEEQANNLHSMRALLQEHSDIEALDERWFLLLILPGGVGRVAS